MSINKSKQSRKNSDLEEKYSKVLDTIKLYPDQLRQAWDEINAMSIPTEFSDIDNIVVCGMGGSTLGARMVDALCEDRLRVPLEIFNGYHIPNYASDKTLLISSSYSGTTEETVACTYEALSRKVKLFIITTGGKLDSIVKENTIPSYVFNPSNNPSEQPRLSIGYAVGAILALLAKLKLIQVSADEIANALVTMKQSFDNYSQENATENLAKKFAQELKGTAPMLVASEHLYGVVYTLKNQFNESAKTFTALYELPELNHHLMEGLKNPNKLKDVIKFVFFESDLYSERVAKRYPLTEEVVGKNFVDYIKYKPTSKTKMNQLFETLVFGSMVVYYLSRYYQIDPMTIPWVDYFKDKLKNS